MLFLFDQARPGAPTRESRARLGASQGSPAPIDDRPRAWRVGANNLVCQLAKLDSFGRV